MGIAAASSWVRSHFEEVEEHRLGLKHPALTGVRGIAAVAVAIYHLAYLKLPEHISGYIFPGYLAVDLFFILSGFIMSVNYAARLTGSNARSEYGEFLKSRFARVYPVYFLLCIMSMAAYYTVKHRHYDGGTVVLSFLLMQNWGFGLINPQWGKVVFGPSWSISTELLAYLILPLIFIACLKRGRFAAVGLGLACYLAIVMVAHMAPGVRGPLDNNDGQTLWPMLRCLAGFTGGVLAWRINGSPAGRRIHNFGLLFDFLWLAALVGLLAVHGSDVLAVLLFPILIIRLCSPQSLLARSMAGPAIFLLGEISFSLYLIQSDTTNLLQDRLASLLYPHLHFHPRLVASILILGLDLVIALGLYFGIERTARKTIKKRLFGQNRVPPIERDPAAP